jgi:hypothetical protein
MQKTLPLNLAKVSVSGIKPTARENPKVFSLHCSYLGLGSRRRQIVLTLSKNG